MVACGVWAGFELFVDVPQKSTLDLYGFIDGIHI